jgi:hypothetical protein
LEWRGLSEAITHRESSHKFGFSLQPMIEIASGQPAFRVKYFFRASFNLSARRGAV